MRRILSLSLACVLTLAVPAFANQAASKSAQAKAPAGPVPLAELSDFQPAELSDFGPALTS